MFQPHLSHEKVVKRIGQHLNATRDRGLILNHLVTFRLMDADFAGLCGYELNSDPAVTQQ